MGRIKIYRLEYLFVLLLPLLNSIVNVTTNYFPSTLSNPGNIRGIFLFVFLIYFIAKRGVSGNVGKSIFLYCLFILSLVFFSSSFQYSLMQVTKVIIVLSYFSVYKYYIRNTEDLKKLSFVFLLSLFIYNLNFIFAQLYSIGESDYVDDSFYSGGASVGATIIMSFLILTIIPYISVYKKKYRYFTLFNLLLSSAFIFVSMRRSSIIVLILGFALYVFIHRTNIKLVSRVIIVSLISLLFFSVFFLDVFLVRYNSRLDAQERYYESSTIIHTKEGRFNDPSVAFFALKEKGIIALLFGKDVFDSRVLLNTHRELHNGYAALLAGTGFVGLLWVFSILYGIFKSCNIYKIGNRNIPMVYKEIHSQFLILLFTFLMFLFSNRLHNYALPFFAFAYFGSLTSIFGRLKLEWNSNRTNNE